VDRKSPARPSPVLFVSVASKRVVEAALISIAFGGFREILVGWAVIRSGATDGVELLMKMRGWSQGETLACALVFSFCVIGMTLGEARIRNDGKQNGGSVEMLELKDPIPPTLGLEGDVRIRLEIGRDGSVVSATATSGKPMLAQAALESAQNSKFLCRDYESETTTYFMTYTFQAGEHPGPGCCIGDTRTNQKRHGTEVRWLGEHVTVVEPPRCFCSCPWPAPLQKVRSWKCLYLWKCGTRRIWSM
jgi:hypothetical protein